MKNQRWKNIEVQQLEENFPGWGRMIHLKIRRSDGKSGISWDTLQQIKNEMVGQDAWAIEVFPAQDSLVNEANIRHLWLVPPDQAIPDLRHPGY